MIDAPMDTFFAVITAQLQLNQVTWYLLIGSTMSVAGLVRMLVVRDLVARLIAMNVVGIGSLLIILALAARTSGTTTDPVFSALVITGLVITVAFTGLGAVLIRRIEGAQDAEDDAEQEKLHSPDAHSPNTMGRRYRDDR